MERLHGAMIAHKSLKTALDAWAHGDSARSDIASTVSALAQACIEISQIIGLGALAGINGVPTARPGGIDPQRQLDGVANEEIIAALHTQPVALFVSQELDEPLSLREGAPLIVAVDPLDGASNADTNAAVGTIFSILPNTTNPTHLTMGATQLAAGFVVYGPQTVLALTLGAGTQIYTLNRATKTFELTAKAVTVPPTATEFAINASNHWHWEEPIRTYVEDCLRGQSGPRGEDFNMRWTGSFVAEIYRILVRGGIYLYPADRRRGFHLGRRRLIYEANPIAWLIEQAGGAASNGQQRLLGLAANSWHECSPVIIGSAGEVAYVERLHRDPHALTERSPLFSRRGLFRV